MHYLSLTWEDIGGKTGYESCLFLHRQNSTGSRSLYWYRNLSSKELESAVVEVTSTIVH